MGALCTRTEELAVDAGFDVLVIVDCVDVAAENVDSTYDDSGSGLWKAARRSDA